jgi:hypothetical protein
MQSAADNAWRKLHALRFAELPFDCGNAVDPGVVYSEDLRDWSDKATTPDQARMENYIDRYDLRNKRILHIGIGNSGLAQRFHRRVAQIVGTTIDEPEIKVARARAISNYDFVIHNKFLGQNAAVTGKFDFILDNNPTSPCCCIRHLAVMFDFYCEKLTAGGQIVTDRQGLEWVPNGHNRRWSFSFDDLSAVAATAGLSAYRTNRTVYVLSRSPPPRPDRLALSRHIARRARMLPGQIARRAPGEIARISRRAVKRLLLATVPWALPARYRPTKKSK